MKPKLMPKKLNLNKQTIALIGKDEMADVKAGDMPILNFTPFVSLLRCPGVLDKRPSVVPPCPD
ncbi:MAG TPA: class I lanthipeptide [Candidatus Deferrimicrobium sp.]|nr:class I lanthipeptide [Candidatus Deferrimicrobium sp.]